MIVKLFLSLFFCSLIVPSISTSIQVVSGASESDHDIDAMQTFATTFAKYMAQGAEDPELKASITSSLRKDVEVTRREGSKVKKSNLIKEAVSHKYADLVQAETPALIVIDTDGVTFHWRAEVGPYEGETLSFKVVQVHDSDNYMVGKITLPKEP
ncbi:uncharacterized protein MELLADRAFT_64764 [Melampsora larici-populina 98AG31]|uniref:Secreted protein n=1 Tax=Melampsora larici-populina (strain 98AG31 / pathotype 3-4-7) TaxID=747676 RepID=F4RSP6_MELLP|nr:uncharacterized protein MELLADRAFT_64764 [Melampsora larici-populina 98AG31]EGG04638.1 secreted protein [Melampsora larici-populina 98AG31]